MKIRIDVIACRPDVTYIDNRELRMSLLVRVTSLYRNLLHKPRVEKELDDELRASLDFLAEEKIAAGMSPEQARREARIELGGVEQMKEQVREARLGATIERIWRDLGYWL